MTDHGPTPVAEREWISALMLLAGLAIVVALVAFAFAMPALTCGCTQPPPSVVP